MLHLIQFMVIGVVVIVCVVVGAAFGVGICAIVGWPLWYGTAGIIIGFIAGYFLAARLNQKYEAEEEHELFDDYNQY